MLLIGPYGTPLPPKSCNHSVVAFSENLRASKNECGFNAVLSDSKKCIACLLPLSLLLYSSSLTSSQSVNKTTKMYYLFCSEMQNLKTLVIEHLWTDFYFYLIIWSNPGMMYWTHHKFIISFKQGSMGFLHFLIILMCFTFVFHNVHI